MPQNPECRQAKDLSVKSAQSAGFSQAGDISGQRINLKVDRALDNFFDDIDNTKNNTDKS